MPRELSRKFFSSKPWDYGTQMGYPTAGFIYSPREVVPRARNEARKKKDSTMTSTTIPTTTTQPPRHPKVKSFINHIITSTKITDELYENYYWVNPYELIFAA